MELSTAIRLIEKGISNSETAQTWADFGAGAGLFTRALANCLHSKSTIYAIDKDATALAKLDTRSLNIEVKKRNQDFITDPVDIELLDGILMANALHFVKMKQAFLAQLRKKLKPSGRMIIIEYDMTQGNIWVPYPVNFKALENVARDIGFTTIKLDEAPSLYNKTVMYSARLVGGVMHRELEFNVK